MKVLKFRPRPPGFRRWPQEAVLREQGRWGWVITMDVTELGLRDGLKALRLKNNDKNEPGDSEER